MIPSFYPKSELIATGSEDGQVFVWNRKKLRRARYSDDENVNQVRLNQVYVKMKENQSESFIPFNVKEKHQKPTIANIALFAPEPTVFYAN